MGKRGGGCNGWFLVGAEGETDVEKEDGKSSRQCGGLGCMYAWDGVEMKKKNKDNAETLTKC